jgi:uncharacterized protein DUF1580
MIDVTLEQPLPLAVLARKVPNRHGKRGVNVSTIWRWIQRGVHGVRLESVLIGGIRMSTEPALSRFFSATTAAANGEPAPIPTDKQHQRAIAAAEKELAEAGI